MSFNVLVQPRLLGLALTFSLVACSGGAALESPDPEPQVFRPDSKEPTLIEIADSVEDFSSVQGEASWYYGYFEECAMGTQGNCVDEFQELIFFEDLDWWATSDHSTLGYTSTVLKANQAHPNAPSGSPNQSQVYQSAVRRWISEVSGTIVLTGKISSGSENFSMGDGTVAFVVVDGSREFRFELKPSDTEGVSYEIEVLVEEGSTIDFVLEGNENSFFDTTEFTSKIFLLQD